MRAVVLCILLAVTDRAFGKIDPEFSESRRCASLIPHFERKYMIPKDRLYAIALQESGKQHSEHKIRIIWPWAVNLDGASYFFVDKKSAVSFVKEQIIAGQTNIDVGCMQISLKNHYDAFDSIEQAFDPGYNIAYGAAFLRSKYEQTGDWKEAIGLYHSATADLKAKYTQSVTKIADNIVPYKATLRNLSISTSKYQKNQSPKRFHKKKNVRD